MKIKPPVLCCICSGKASMNIEIVFLFLIMAVFPLGQLVRVVLPGLAGLTLQPIDLLVFIFNLSWFVKILLEKKKPFFLPAFKEMLLFGGFALLTLVININNFSIPENIIGLFYLLRLVNYFVFYPAFFSFLKKTHIQILKIMFFEGILIGGIAIIQYLTVPDTRFLYFLGWDEHYFRAIGSFLDPVFTGIILVFSFFVLPLLLERKIVKKITAIAGGLIILVSLGLTFSRISYVILILSMTFYFVIKKKFKRILVGLTGFFLLVLFLPKPTGEGVDLLRTSSFFRRSDNYREAVTVIKDNFWLGVGFNRYRPALKKYGFNLENKWGESHSGAGADNSFLLVLATTGIFGLILYLNVWRIIGKESVKQYRKGNYLLALTSISLLIFSFTTNGLFYPWLLVWLMAILAWSTAEN